MTTNSRGYTYIDWSGIDNQMKVPEVMDIIVGKENNSNLLKVSNDLDNIEMNVAALHEDLVAIQALNSSIVLGTVHHQLNKYPHSILYKTSWAAGSGGAGNGPAGGTSLIKINGGFELNGFDKLIVSAPKEFENFTIINSISASEFSFTNGNSEDSLLLVLQ